MKTEEEKGFVKESEPKQEQEIKILELIMRMSEYKGREGCTADDTKFDSLSAAYGYNMCLNAIKKLIVKNVPSMANWPKGNLNLELITKDEL